MKNIKGLGYFLLIPFLTINYNCSDDNDDHDHDHNHDHDSTNQVATVMEHFTDNESISVTSVYTESDLIHIESYGIPDHPTTNESIAWNQRVQGHQVQMVRYRYDRDTATNNFRTHSKHEPG